MSQDFDINDPNLQLDTPEGYNPEGDLVGGIPAPIADGVNRVALFLAEDTESKNAVRFSKGKVVATFNVRPVKEDGSVPDVSYSIKDFYPTSQVFEGQSTAALDNLCKLAGRPIPSRQPGAYIKHVYSVFSPDTPFFVQAKTQWVKSTPVIDPFTGEHQLDSQTGYKMYNELKGQAKIAQAAVAEAHARAQEQGLDEEATQAAITYAANHPHLYIDPISGDEKSVRAEVRYIVGK